MIFVHIVVSALIILILLGNISTFDLKSKWKTIQKETKSILIESWNKTRGISQVGPKPGFYLDYPGSDVEKLNTNRRLWELYYKCLEEFVKNVNKNNIHQAKVMTVFRSESIR